MSYTKAQERIEYEDLARLPTFSWHCVDTRYSKAWVALRDGNWERFQEELDVSSSFATELHLLESPKITDAWKKLKEYTREHFDRENALVSVQNEDSRRDAQETLLKPAGNIHHESRWSPLTEDFVTLAKLMCRHSARMGFHTPGTYRQEALLKLDVQEFQDEIWPPVPCETDTELRLGEPKFKFKWESMEKFFNSLRQKDVRKLLDDGFLGLLGPEDASVSMVATWDPTFAAEVAKTRDLLKGLTSSASLEPPWQLAKLEIEGMRAMVRCRDITPWYKLQWEEKLENLLSDAKSHWPETKYRAEFWYV